ncbi:MAG: undecaprenyl-diphosphate phosphatase, partial [Corynebacterium kroppenstedtii]|nr:undecaprenyl-diphosphate phosphatase [Corynebacterium kroppenstedtii]
MANSALTSISGVVHDAFTHVHQLHQAHGFLGSATGRIHETASSLAQSPASWLSQTGASAHAASHAHVASDLAAAGTETHMSWIQTIILSIIQGLTEFLPVSSSGHLRIVSQLLWNQDAGASFTAVVQLGTEAAVLVFFAKDIWRIITGWFAGL